MQVEENKKMVWEVIRKCSMNTNAVEDKVTGKQTAYPHNWINVGLDD